MSPAPADITIDQRHTMTPREHIFLIGPGGVGKSTLGRLLATHSDRTAVDLDLEFCDRIGEIGAFIRKDGYQRYRELNLALAKDLVAAQPAPIVFVTSSGFLAAAEDTQDYRQAFALVGTGYSICLLPSLDRDTATEIVASRQLLRGFGAERLSETDKFRRRFD